MVRHQTIGARTKTPFMLHVYHLSQYDKNNLQDSGPYENLFQLCQLTKAVDCTHVGVWSIHCTFRSCELLRTNISYSTFKDSLKPVDLKIQFQAKSEIRNSFQTNLHFPGWCAVTAVEYPLPWGLVATLENYFCPSRDYIYTNIMYIFSQATSTFDNDEMMYNTCMNNFDHSKHLERPSSDEAFQILPLTLTSHIRD